MGGPHVQCNIIDAVGRLQDIITFVIVRCRQMKIFKKLIDLEILTHKENKIQRQPLRRVLQKYPFYKKPLLKCNSTENMAKILEKYI